MLIAIVMVMGGVVTLLFTTQTMPEKVPMAYLGISKSTDGVELINKAGDSLTSSSVTIIVDGVDRTSEFRTQANTPGWVTLKAGEHLSYSGARNPESVQIVYSGNSGQYLLASTESTFNAPILIGSSQTITLQSGEKPVSKQAFDAQYVSGTIPATMSPGLSYPVSVTMKNTGSMAWDETTMVRLGGVGDGAGDAAKFGPARISIPNGTSIPSGSQHTFNFTMIAPSGGSFTPRYKMVWEGHQWFGAESSQSVQIAGKATVDAQYVSGTIPATMSPGQCYPVSVTMKNTGSMAWDETHMVRLGGVGDGAGDAAKFGPVRMSIPRGTSIPTGSQYTFNFTMFASSEGSFTPQYKMVWEGHQWFGQVASQPVIIASSKNLPHADFTSNVTQGSSPLFVQFTDRSTGAGPMTYHWDFSDGSGNLPENSQQNPVWRFWEDAGTAYTVTLTVTNAYGSDTIVKQNYIRLGTEPTTPPVAAFTSNLQKGIAPLTVQFTDESLGTPLTYAWDVNNDGSTDYTTKNPSHTYTDAGDYTVKLTTSNAGGSSSEVKTGYIVVSAGGIIPRPTLPAPEPTDSITVTSPEAGETWQRGTTHTIAWDYTGSPGSLVKITLLKSGTEAGTIHEGTSIGTNGHGSYSWQIYPAASTGNDYAVCVQSLSESDIQDTSTGYFTLTPAGTTTQAPTPAPTPATTASPAKLPSAQFSASTTQGKAPMTVQFTDTSVSTGTTSYAWDVNNDGSTDYTTKNPSHTYTAAGTYSVKLTVTNTSGSDSEIKTGYITAASSTGQTGDCYGAITCNPTGNPIGGGPGYSRIITGTEATVKYSVSTKAELLTALKSAKSGEIVFVKGSSTIDMTGTPSVTIPAGVTLAGNRGVSGSSGALIKRTKNLNGGWEEPMFIAGGDNVRVTGLQLEGEMYPQDYGNGEVYPGSIHERYYLVGLSATGVKNFEVDNNELRGWAWASVSLRQANAANIHHNYIHHNQARGEGYGVCLYGGNALIEANRFDYNRHDVTGAGMSGEQYEARYNHHLGHGNAIGAANYDVHQDEETGTGAAGARFLIHHNSIDTGVIAAVHIRARPTIGCYVNNNIINAKATDTGVPGGLPIYQTNSNQNMFVTNNYWMGKLYSGGTGIIWYQ